METLTRDDVLVDKECLVSAREGCQDPHCVLCVVCDGADEGLADFALPVAPVFRDGFCALGEDGFDKAADVVFVDLGPAEAGDRDVAGVEVKEVLVEEGGEGAGDWCGPGPW